MELSDLERSLWGQEFETRFSLRDFLVGTLSKFSMDVMSMHLGISLPAEIILYHTKIIKLNFLTVIITGKSGLHFTMMIWNKSNTYE